METNVTSANSEEFISCLIWSGHASVSCGCGRSHAAMQNTDWNNDQRNNLYEVSRQDPDKFIIHENDEYIELAEIGNMQFVNGCPCMQLLELERFVWTARKEILSYYKQIQSKMERENMSLKQTIESIDKRLSKNNGEFDS